MKVYHSDNYAPPQQRKKDHKCPHCNKMFAFNGNLIRHMEIHDPTSRIFEEKKLLKIGRMKRVQPDGTIIEPQIETSNDLEQTNNDESDEFFYEVNDEGEQQQQDQQIEDEEIPEVQYEDDDDGEEYNGNNIQYVYDDLQDEGYEILEHQDDQVEYEIEEEEENEQIQNIVDIKSEKLNTMENIIIKTDGDGNNDNLEYISLAEQDNQGFMVIEVLPDEDEEDPVQAKQQIVQNFPVPTTLQTKPAILNKKAHKAKPKSKFLYIK